MSEYQYYEFQAVDRPLDDRARAALRAISSRADITPSRLVNVYHFGDFKGDPDRLMDQYFDAHLYVANWGTRRLMLRVPARAFPLASARPYAAPPPSSRCGPRSSTSSSTSSPGPRTGTRTSRRGRAGWPR